MSAVCCQVADASRDDTSFLNVTPQSSLASYFPQLRIRVHTKHTAFFADATVSLRPCASRDPVGRTISNSSTMSFPESQELGPSMAANEDYSLGDDEDLQQIVGGTATSHFGDEDEEIEFDSQFLELRRAYMNEKLSPEILPFKGSLVEYTINALSDQEDRIDETEVESVGTSPTCADRCENYLCSCVQPLSWKVTDKFCT